MPDRVPPASHRDHRRDLAHSHRPHHDQPFPSRTPTSSSSRARQPGSNYRSAALELRDHTRPRPAHVLQLHLPHRAARRRGHGEVQRVPISRPSRVSPPRRVPIIVIFISQPPCKAQGLKRPRMMPDISVLLGRAIWELPSCCRGTFWRQCPHLATWLVGGIDSRQLAG